MIFGTFIGTTVKGATRAVQAVQKAEARVVNAKMVAKGVINHAMADRAAAIAELKKDMDALGALIAKV